MKSKSTATSNRQSKQPLRCPECFQPLDRFRCSGAKDYYPKGGCREPKILRLRKTKKNRAKQRQDPTYQQYVERLTTHRLASLAEPQPRPKLTKEDLKKLRPKPTQDGWLKFPGAVSSWFHDLPEADLQTVHGPLEGIQQETEHWVSATLPPKDEQAVFETRCAVYDLQRQLKASSLTRAELDQAITHLSRQALPRQNDGWVWWLVLNNAPPWGFYPWSLTVTKLTTPSRSSVVVHASLHLRPGTSKRDAKEAAEKAMELLGPSRIGHRPKMREAIKQEAYRLFEQFHPQPAHGKPRHIQNTKESLEQSGYFASAPFLRALYRQWKAERKAR